ncbi:hypothetical protein V2J09_012388 [Rumex salicifolius]
MGDPMSRKSPSFSLRSASLNSVRLRRVFDMFDKNGDELITADEIARALASLGLEADPTESALVSAINSFLKPGSAGLTFEDFAALHKSVDEAFIAEESEIECGDSQEESDLMEAFKVFDEDGDGYISARELQVVLDKLGMPEAKEMERVEKMISSVDRNHDGVVDFSEFKDMMRNVIALIKDTNHILVEEEHKDSNLPIDK